jgi:HPt (histidine-containing phosphotransfer) domain-containing protein
MAGDPRVQELLARLRDRYLESVAGKSDALALALCRHLTEQDEEHRWRDALLSDAAPFKPASPAPRLTADGETSLELAIRLAHSMVGSGASYGFPDITDRARVIETALRALPEESSHRLAMLLDALQQALQLREAIQGISETTPFG